MPGHQIGYVRVSSVDQCEDRQLADIELDKVFTDKCSGTTRKRPALVECLEWCRAGDTLRVHSIDRLARDLRDLSNIVSELVDKGVTVCFETQRLTFSADHSDPLSTLMLQQLGAYAEFEGSMIRSRQKEGIAIAKKKGTKFGAKPKLTPEQIEKVRALIAEGQTKKNVAAKFKVSRPTLDKALNQ